MKTVDADRALKEAKKIAKRETEYVYPNSELYKTARSRYYWSILYREFHSFMGTDYAC